MKYFLILSLVLFTQSISYASDSLHEDINNLNQQDLRTYLHKNLPNITDAKKEDFLANTVYFYLPKEISSNVEEKCVLEVGCSVGASVRAFAKAKEVSIVEPDVNALSLAFDKNWTKNADDSRMICQQHKSQFGYESDEETCQRMNLEGSWATHIDPQLPWISDSVLIYPCRLENLPEILNQHFDLIAYKDFQVSNDLHNNFFKRLSYLLTPTGRVVIQFWADQLTFDTGKNNIKSGKDSLLENIENHFRKIEYIYDDKGTREISSENPLIISDYPNKPEIRFLILSYPKN